MAAGVTDRVLKVSNSLSLLEELPEKPNYRDTLYGPALGFDLNSTRGT
jgi:hypothetical protein